MATQMQHMQAQSRNQRTTIASLNADVATITAERDAALGRVRELEQVVVRMANLQMRIEDVRCTENHPGGHQTITLLQEEFDELVRDNRGESKEGGA